MAHQKIDDQVIIDWETGDPEKDRTTYFQAMKLFIRELIELTQDESTTNQDVANLLDRWSISELDIDSFPRININFPEGFTRPKKGDII